MKKLSVLLLVIVALFAGCQTDGGYPSTLFPSFVSQDTSTERVGDTVKIHFTIKFEMTAWDRPAYFEIPQLLWRAETFDFKLIDVGNPFAVQASLSPDTDISKVGNVYRLGINQTVAMTLQVTVTTLKSNTGLYAVYLKKFPFSRNGNDGDYESTILFPENFRTLPVAIR